MQAAAALEEAWRAARPADTVERVAVLDFVSKLSRKLYSEGCVKVMDHAPELYAHRFKQTDRPALMRKLTRVRRRVPPPRKGEGVEAQTLPLFQPTPAGKWHPFTKPANWGFLAVFSG